MTALPNDQQACPDENALAELVQGLLDPRAASQLESHLDGCVECRRIVSSVGQSSYIAQRLTRVDAALGADATWVMVEPTKTLPAGAPPPNTAIRNAGEILAGKYQIERLLGQGGMGVVMAAKHLTLGKLIAIKLMRPDLLVDTNAAQRFVREARAASRLRSEHIVRVIDLDRLDDGAPYIAMEYLEGEDLGALLQRGPITANEAATYVVQVCEAVTEAHAAGIVHRDLKPANLFVTRRGDGSPCMKVLDFGVSKIIAGGPLADELTSTDTKSLVGSPHYMAPEQLISAKAVDPRTDVWALGCILFELVSGRNPFAGTALAQVLASILRDEIPPLLQLCPHLPPGFAAVVARCLEKDPARRFQRVDELAVALAPFVGGSGPAITRVAPARAPVEPERRARWLLVVAALLVASAGVVGYQVASQKEQPEPNPAARLEPAIVTPPISVAPSDAGVQPIATDAAIAPPAAAPVRRRASPKKRLEDDLLAPQL